MPALTHAADAMLDTATFLEIRLIQLIEGKKIKLMACFQIVCQNSFSGVIFLNSKIIFQTSLEKIFFFNCLDRKKTRRERKTSFTFICAYIKFLKEKTQKDLTSKLPKALSHMAYISLKEIDSSSRGQ